MVRLASRYKRCRRTCFDSIWSCAEASRDGLATARTGVITRTLRRPDFLFFILEAMHPALWTPDKRSAPDPQVTNRKTSPDRFAASDAMPERSSQLQWFWVPLMDLIAAPPETGKKMPIFELVLPYFDTSNGGSAKHLSDRFQPSRGKNIRKNTPTRPVTPRIGFAVACAAWRNLPPCGGGNLAQGFVWSDHAFRRGFEL